MSLDPAIFRALVANGATPDQLLAVVEADAQVEEEKRARKREGNARRQQEWRDRQRNADNALQTVTERDGVTDPAPDKSPQTPKINPTPCEHTQDARARGAAGWKLPAGVDAEHWHDFLANRRTKRLGFTPTAYRGQLKALGDLSDDEWPPGRIVQFAAERGWGAFFDPRGRDNGRRNGHHHGMAGAGQPSSGRGVTVDAALGFIEDQRRLTN